MRPTQIIYAHPDIIALMGANTVTLPNGHEVPRRFSGTRTNIRQRLEAAWLVFTGRADALVWYQEIGRAHV